MRQAFLPTANVPLAMIHGTVQMANWVSSQETADGMLGSFSA